MRRINKVIAGAVVAAAISLTPLASGIASADINIGVGELQECTISKSMDTTTSSSDYSLWQTNFGTAR